MTNLRCAPEGWHKHRTCPKTFQAIMSGNLDIYIRGVISTVVLAELIHRRMMIAEAVERGLVDVRNAVRRLKEIHYKAWRKLWG